MISWIDKHLRKHCDNNTVKLRLITKRAGKIGCSLNRPSQYLIPLTDSIFRKARSDQQLNIAAIYWLQQPSRHLSLERVQKHLNGLVSDELFETLEPLFHRR